MVVVKHLKAVWYPNSYSRLDDLFETLGLCVWSSCTKINILLSLIFFAPATCLSSLLTYKAFFFFKFPTMMAIWQYQHR